MYFQIPPEHETFGVKSHLKKNPPHKNINYEQITQLAVTNIMLKVTSTLFVTLHENKL